jgi:DNA-binding response OmpR family regulator
VKTLDFAEFFLVNCRMGKKVLFIDDDVLWRKRVEVSFADAGYEVVTAMDASEAMVAAEATKFALIILDLNLAGESGLMLMKFLKRNHPEVPVILFTCIDHDDKTVRGMLDMGAEQYLAKNTMEELIVAVSPYLM